MFFFVMLLAFFALLHAPPISGLDALESRRDRASIATSLSFIVSGSMHFASPQRFLSMMPPWLPWHLELIYISGFCELLGAIGLMMKRTRRMAAYGLIALLLAVFPANVHVALSGGVVEGLPQQSWYYWARLPFQLVFIAWLVWCVKEVQPALKNAGAVKDPR